MCGAMLSTVLDEDDEDDDDDDDDAFSIAAASEALVTSSITETRKIDRSIDRLTSYG